MEVFLYELPTPDTLELPWLGKISLKECSFRLLVAYTYKH